MLRLNSEKFLSLLNELSVLHGILLPVDGVGHQITSITVDPTMRKDAEEISSLASDLGLEMTVKEAARLISVFEKDSVKGPDLRNRIDALKHEIQDELSLRSIWILGPEQHKLFTTFAPFGEDVAAKFLDTAKDLEEAAKCLALLRGTACVFHLMCALDLALQKFSRHLKANYDPKWDWNKVLENIKAKIDPMTTTTKARLIKKEKYLSAYTHLHGVRGAWRNPAMHSRRQYEVTEAREIFNAVGAFMRDLTKIL